MSIVLETLNDRLLGRAGGHFATCVVAHLRPGGSEGKYGGSDVEPCEQFDAEEADSQEDDRRQG
jgi:hypothetical protein